MLSLEAVYLHFFEIPVDAKDSERRQWGPEIEYTRVLLAISAMRYCRVVDGGRGRHAGGDIMTL